jgi:hypothetical protein
MYSVNILLGCFIFCIGVMLFVATHNKKIALPLIMGGIALALTMAVMAF